MNTKNESEARNRVLEDVANWYKDKGWLLDEDDVPAAIRSLASTPSAAMQGQGVQTDLAKRLLDEAYKCRDQFNVVTVLKADLIAICCEANRYYIGMMNWKRAAEAPAAQPQAGGRELTDADEARGLLKRAIKYVHGAYECAFPDEQANQELIDDIEAYLTGQAGNASHITGTKGATE